MKSVLVRARIMLGLALMSLVIALINRVDAHEDPTENDKRQQVARLADFRSTYRRLYIYDRAQPVSPMLLKTYPKAAMDIIDKLSLFGTAHWPKKYDLVALLSALDYTTETLLLTSFHPAVIERQSEHIREQHFLVSEKMVEWIFEHIDGLAQITGQADAQDRLRHYMAVRDLAAVGSMIPHA